MNDGRSERQKLTEATRIVVKIGSRVLVQRNGRPDEARMRILVKQIAALKQGRQVVLVTSGAVGAGMEALGLKKRPVNLPDLQMAAAVGQSRLMTKYDRLFGAQRCRIGQVLLTHDGLRDRVRHLNARNTIMNLLRNGIVPIVNENDAVAVDEMKVGDNDVLASLVSLLIEADLLIMLSTADGLRERMASGRTRRVRYIEHVTRETLALAEGKGSDLSTGGMATKLAAARTASQVGTPVVIANGRKDDIITQIIAGDDVGTMIGSFITASERRMRGRKRWIAFFHRAEGSLTIDEGAREALVTRGRSLLPIGIKEVQGDFGIGSVVNIKAEDGTQVARGLVEYSMDEISRIKGHKTSEIAGLLGRKDYDEVVHRDNMVLLSQ
ncbi:MAG: glutamate 5-kinase [Verrucomicrobia bacterium]|nr:glutamate 5-kinase [Verrucomicrobiota bacterium]